MGNATKSDWQQWKDGAERSVHVKRVILEGTCEGRDVKMDITEHYLELQRTFIASKSY